MVKKFILWLLSGGMVFLYNSMGNGEVISSEKLFSICKEYLLTQLDYPEEKLIFNLTQGSNSIELPQGVIEYKVFGKVDRERLGKVPLKVDIYVEGNLFRTVYPVIELDIKSTALVTTRWIKRGEPFSQENTTVKEVASSSLPPYAIRDFKELEGKISKLALGEGRIITYSHIDEPALIKRNQVVNLVVNTSSLKVETKGIALVDGRGGAIVKVKNIDTGKIIYGEVKDKDTVLVSVP
ncbi:MAG: flagellar basal body P-ring formation chaperone FlgA [Candidatus Omnitrophica bacterium]|nr:flagellar basal body P-ring formation chaperone FlgA [Candidatus Omnitrophota bacterium]